MRWSRWAIALLALAGLPSRASTQHSRGALPHTTQLDRARQLIVVTTLAWDSTAGVLRRYTRRSATSPWLKVGPTVPIVVGRNGLAWDSEFATGATDAPVKREGDGRAPAGVFPLDTAFGFAPASDARGIALPYRELTAGTDCVDDTTSKFYNQIVDRARVSTVDWTSAEHMRQIGQYRYGVVVAYNAQPPRAGRGSCIFLHIWGGPRSSTAGCTAMPQRDIEALLRWLDPARRPVLVQLPMKQYAALHRAWRLP